MVDAVEEAPKGPSGRRLGLPSDELLNDASRQVLRAAGTVVSLAQLLTHVRRRLGEMSSGVRIGPRRLRRAMATAPFCRMEIRTRKGSTRRVMTRCPVCSSRLAPVRNQTLFGGDVVLTLRCTTCVYRTGKAKRVPTLYTFHHVAR